MRILDSIDWDVSELEKMNKRDRNIQIGKIQINNPDLSSYLISNINSLIQFYVSENSLTDSDIIVTQRDGFISTKLLEKTEDFLELDLRSYIDFIVLTPDRKKYMTCGTDGVTVKGVKGKYHNLDLVYEKFRKLNFYDRKTLFAQLNNIQKLVLDNPNPEFYMVDVDGKNAIQTKKHGTILVANSSLVDVKAVDTNKYFNHFFREFFESIFLEFI
jgi:hypothetical protein